MKRNNIYEGMVTDSIAFGGKAKVITDSSGDEDDRKEIAVKNVIPGQRIAFRLKRQSRGDLFEVLERSPLETEAICPIFGECGGCVYLSMDHETQNNMKLEMVRGLCREAGYEVEKGCCVDMFPGTGHVETVCLLSNTQRKKKESYITLDVEMEDYYRIKNEGKDSNTGK